MTESFYHECKPIKLSDSVFKLYQLIEFDLRRSPGIIVDDGCSEFMFVKQADILLKIQGQEPKRLPRCFSIGKMKKPYKLQYSGKINLFAVKLQPWVAGFFFPNEVINDVSDLTLSYGSNIETLCEDIFNADSFEEKVKKVEKFFSKIETPEPDNFKVTMEICRKIYQSKGMISVRKLLNDFSESRQKINRDFLFNTKYTIKEFSIFIKIREAIKFLHKNPNTSLTEIAQEFGYFDQSHFIKDIRRVTSVTPTKLFSTKNLVKEQLVNSADLA